MVLGCAGPLSLLEKPCWSACCMLAYHARQFPHGARHLAATFCLGFLPFAGGTSFGVIQGEKTLTTLSIHHLHCLWCLLNVNYCGFNAFTWAKMRWIEPSGPSQLICNDKRHSLHLPLWSSYYSCDTMWSFLPPSQRYEWEHHAPSLSCSLVEDDIGNRNHTCENRYSADADEHVCERSHPLSPAQTVTTQRPQASLWIRGTRVAATRCVSPAVNWGASCRCYRLRWWAPRWLHAQLYGLNPNRLWRGAPTSVSIMIDYKLL